MPTINLTEEQLRLIQTALDFYSRAGILQFETILDHPTVQQCVEDRFTSKEPLKVGDQTRYGEIVRMSKKFVWTRGTWNGVEEVRKFLRSEVKRSPNWELVHQARNAIRDLCQTLKLLMTGENFGNGSFGIYSNRVDESCRTAFDMVQIIRHEFWKLRDDKLNYSVDANVHFTAETNDFIVEINDER